MGCLGFLCFVSTRKCRFRTCTYVWFGTSARIFLVGFPIVFMSHSDCYCFFIFILQKTGLHCYLPLSLACFENIIFCCNVQDPESCSACLASIPRSLYSCVWNITSLVFQDEELSVPSLCLQTSLYYCNHITLPRSRTTVLPGSAGLGLSRTPCTCTPLFTLTVANETSPFQTSSTSPLQAATPSSGPPPTARRRRR